MAHKNAAGAPQIVPIGGNARRDVGAQPETMETGTRRFRPAAPETMTDAQRELWILLEDLTDISREYYELTSAPENSPLMRALAQLEEERTRTTETIKSKLAKTPSLLTGFSHPGYRLQVITSHSITYDPAAVEEMFPAQAELYIKKIVDAKAFTSFLDSIKAPQELVDQLGETVAGKPYARISDVTGK